MFSSNNAISKGSALSQVYLAVGMKMDETDIFAYLN